MVDVELLRLQLKLIETLAPMLQPQPAPFSHESAEIDAGGPRSRGIYLHLEFPQ